MCHDDEAARTRGERAHSQRARRSARCPKVKVIGMSTSVEPLYVRSCSRPVPRAT
jgi:hypothetical protein